MAEQHHNEDTPPLPKLVATTNVDTDEHTYIDPRSYSSVNQALFAVAHEMNPQNIKLVEEIGEGCVLLLQRLPYYFITQLYGNVNVTQETLVRCSEDTG